MTPSFWNNAEILMLYERMLLRHFSFFVIFDLRIKRRIIAVNIFRRPWMSTIK